MSKIMYVVLTDDQISHHKAKCNFVQLTICLPIGLICCAKGTQSLNQQGSLHLARWKVGNGGLLKTTHLKSRGRSRLPLPGRHLKASWDRDLCVSQC